MQTSEIEQSLNRAVLAEGAVHNGENDVDALAASAAVQPYESGVGRVGGHHHALAAFQDFRQHFLRARADKPVAFLGDADGHCFVFVRVEAANNGGSGGEGNFVFAGAATEEDANAKSFFVVGSHESVSFCRAVQFKVISFQL